MIRSHICGLILVLNLAGIGACDADTTTTRAEGTYYFHSFDGKRLPETPLNEFSVATSADLLEHTVYYVAHYNEDGRLDCFAKFYRGKPRWLSRYGYGGDPTPSWREFFDLDDNAWRRDDPWNGNASRETTMPIKDHIDAGCSKGGQD